MKSNKHQLTTRTKTKCKKSKKNVSQESQHNFNDKLKCDD